MTMSYDYENRRERNQPTNQKRRRGERQPVPLDQRPGNPGYRKPVNVRALVFWMLLALALFAVLAAVVR